MSRGERARRVRLTVSVSPAIAELVRREAAEHERSVACEGGLLIRLGLEARGAGRAAAAAGDKGTEASRR